MHHYQDVVESERKILHGDADDMKDIIKHITGVNRLQNPTQQSTGELHSIRRSGGIGDRIRRAEAAEAKPELMEQRRKEYDARISALEKPEVEVLNNEAG